MANNGRSVRNASPQCRSLLLEMFTWNYADRPSIYDVLSNIWFQHPTGSEDGSHSVAVNPSILHTSTQHDS